jgi:acyl dehydratase
MRTMVKKNVKDFLQDSTAMIGSEAVEVPPANDDVDYYAIDNFCRATGDDNPLFMDPTYATKTKYGCLIAPPTFLVAIRHPGTEGAYAQADYGLAKLLTGVDFEWFDVVRCGDYAQTSLQLVEIGEKKGWKNRQTAILTSQATYWNRYGGLLGKATGTMTFIPLERGKELIVDREMFRHTKEDIQRIENGIQSEVVRGAKPLYWDEVQVGDELPPVVKGAVDQSDLIHWQEATAPFLKITEEAIKETMALPGKRRVNPATGWPYYHVDQAPEDFSAAPLNGISLPYVRGVEIASLAGSLLTNWMGDEGFLQRLNVVIHQPLLYGDTGFYSGTVREKYKLKLGEMVYRAVDVEVKAVNQINEPVLTGTATIFLPSPGHEVVLPIPELT